MIPLYGFLQGDTMGLLILADENGTVSLLSKRLISSAQIRVHFSGPVRVIYKGVDLDLNTLLKDIPIEPLDRFDVLADEA